MMNSYTGRILIDPVLSTAEYDYLLEYYEHIKNYRESGQKSELENFLGFSIEKNKSYYFFSSFCPNLTLTNSSIELKDGFFERSNLKPTLEALAFFFFQQQRLVDYLELDFFHQHTMNGTVHGQDEKTRQWQYVVEHNTVYNQDLNLGRKVGERYQEPHFKPKSFDDWSERIELKKAIKSGVRPKTLKI